MEGDDDDDDDDKEEEEPLPSFLSSWNRQRERDCMRKSMRKEEKGYFSFHPSVFPLPSSAVRSLVSALGKRKQSGWVGPYPLYRSAFLPLPMLFQPLPSLSRSHEMRRRRGNQQLFRLEVLH